MNLAQCIDPEWVQQGSKERHAWLRPLDYVEPRRGLVGQDSNHRPLDQGHVMERAAPRVAKPVAPVTPPAPRRRGSGGQRRTDDNPWPRGKRGLRFLVLELIAESSRPKVSLNDLIGRVGEYAPQQVYLTLRDLSADKWLERTGTAKAYRYAITEAGRKALKA